MKTRHEKNGGKGQQHAHDCPFPERACSMRRRKKDKPVQREPVSSAEDNLEPSTRGLSVKFAKNVEGGGGTENRSPLVQPRKRSLLGSLGSMRDLVEQVGEGGFLVGVYPAVQFGVIFILQLELVLSLRVVGRCSFERSSDCGHFCGLQQQHKQQQHDERKQNRKQKQTQNT